MKSLERSKAVVDLGKRLIAELNLADDLLTQWMAHMIAERIDATEKASNEDKVAAQDACQQAIFNLWERRNSIPLEARPLQELEPLIHTLDSLNVDSAVRYRHFQERPSDEEMDAVEGSAKNFLELARRLDYSARVLIHFLISSAAKDAAEQAIPWLEALAKAGADSRYVLPYVQFALNGPGAHEANERELKSLAEKIEHLESFSNIATGVATELRSRMAQLAGEGGVGESDSEP